MVKKRSKKFGQGPKENIFFQEVFPNASAPSKDPPDVILCQLLIVKTSVCKYNLTPLIAA